MMQAFDKEVFLQGFADLFHVPYEEMAAHYNAMFAAPTLPKAFRAQGGKLLPGSLCLNGDVIDVHGQRHINGPCFVPFYKLSPARKGLMVEAGWHMQRGGGNWPDIPNRGWACIVRKVPSGYRTALLESGLYDQGS